MSMQDSITKKLNEAFSPSEMEVINESHHHSGHMGDDGSGESHFRIKITAEAFAGKSRVETHRMINELLADELRGDIHALAISAKAP